ncbi:MAG: terminase TerL endonuclease subunit [Phycisphaerae bacterium]
MTPATKTRKRQKAKGKRRRRKSRRPSWRREWVRSERDERAVAAGYTFDLKAAEHVRQFFVQFLRHSKGQWAGQPFELLDWQWREVVGPLFGWRRPDGLRRYRQAYVEVPKKNGKSTLCAGIALYLLAADGEPGAEVYSAAADRDQAGLIYDEAANMTEASPHLGGRAIVRRSTKTIAWPLTQSFYKALSADTPTKEGLNIHGLLFDELHAQRTRRLWDTLRYGIAARRQPMIVAITTAGWDRETICWEQHEYAEQVAEGVIEDPSFLPVLYGADPEEDDWTRAETWRRVNPSLGVTITEASMAADCAEARASPRKENAFKRRRLNIWTEQAERWLRLEDWDAGAVERLPDLAGRPCFAGLDLSSTTDLTAFVLLFPPKAEGEPWWLVPEFWVPGERAPEREDRDKVPYRTWGQQGYIHLTPGPVVDYGRVRARIGELGETYRIVEIAIDRWNATQLMGDLEADGFTMVPFGQGYASMSAPSKELETLVVARRIGHDGHPVMRWCVRNAATEEDAAENLKPSKKRSSERIDGIVAAVMALGRAMVTDEGRLESVYERRGVLRV